MLTFGRQSIHLTTTIAVEEVKNEGNAMTPKRVISAPNSGLGQQGNGCLGSCKKACVTLLRYI